MANTVTMERTGASNTPSFLSTDSLGIVWDNDAGQSCPKIENAAETGRILVSFPANRAVYAELARIHPRRWDTERQAMEVPSTAKQKATDILVAYCGYCVDLCAGSPRLVVGSEGMKTLTQEEQRAVKERRSQEHLEEVREWSESMRQRFDTGVTHAMDTLRAVAYKLTTRHDDRDDLVGETLAKAYAAFDQFRVIVNGEVLENSTNEEFKRSFQQWLIGILYRCRIDSLRSANGREALALDVIQSQADENRSGEEIFQEMPKTGASDLLDEVMRRIEQQRIRDAIAQLPENYRNAVLLCDLEGYQYNEASEILNVTTWMVRNNLNRGRKRLREILKGYFDEE